MPPPPPTVLAHKLAFLTAQTLHLSQTLSPSPTWRRHDDRNHNNDNDDPSSSSHHQVPLLTQKAVDDALYRLNQTLQQHVRRVYAPQASRHVAEQIEGLFLDAGERGLREDDYDDDDDDDGGVGEEGNGEGGGGEDGGDGGQVVPGGGGGSGGGREIDPVKRREKLRVGTDYTTDEAISHLASTWSSSSSSSRHHHASEAEAEAHPLEAQRYADLTATLRTLSARRRAVRERVERLRALNAVLAPFNGGGGGGRGDAEGDNNNNNKEDNPATGVAAVQQNLVTRNGEVERELERMRVLLVRVSGRLAGLVSDDNNNNNKDDDDDQEALRRRKQKKRKRGDRTNDEVSGSGTGGGGRGRGGGGGRGGGDVLTQDVDMLSRGKVDRLLDNF